MKKAPLPYNEPADTQPDDEQGFNDFLDGVGFRHKIHDRDFPEKGTGMHVPLWVTPKLAHEILGRHGRTGHALPHQDDDLY